MNLNIIMTLSYQIIYWPNSLLEFFLALISNLLYVTCEKTTLLIKKKHCSKYLVTLKNIFEYIHFIELSQCRN